jgi:hypothetical protein
LNAVEEFLSSLLRFEVWDICKIGRDGLPLISISGDLSHDGPVIDISLYIGRSENLGTIQRGHESCLYHSMDPSLHRQVWDFFPAIDS